MLTFSYRTRRISSHCFLFFFFFLSQVNAEFRVRSKVGDCDSFHGYFIASTGYGLSTVSIWALEVQIRASEYEFVLYFWLGCTFQVVRPNHIHFRAH